MDAIAFLIDFILHVDKHLEAFVATYGLWVYALLFLIVFVETGLVVMPFLPGDSLLFIVGALCGAGMMEFAPAVAVLLAAAVLGDQCNYSIGRWFGPRVFQWESSPFVAGVAEMSRAKFSAYNIGGAVLWVLGITSAGLFFGNLAFVREHLDKIIWGLILVPGLIALFGAWRGSRKGAVSS